MDEIRTEETTIIAEEPRRPNWIPYLIGGLVVILLAAVGYARTRQTGIGDVCSATVACTEGYCYAFEGERVATCHPVPGCDMCDRTDRCVQDSRNPPQVSCMSQPVVVPVPSSVPSSVPVSSPVPSSVVSSVPSSVPSSISISSPVPSETVMVFFANNDAAFFSPVARRQISATGEMRITATIRALVEGPTTEEKRQGAIQLFDSSLRLTSVRVTDSGIRCIRAPCPTSIVHLYFEGKLCSTPGAAFNEGALVMKTMEQFDDVHATKIYLDGQTQEPGGTENSVPACLEP